MQIGGLSLSNPLCLAPLAGVTSLPLREFFTQLGAALTHTEMVSCAGLVRDNAKTAGMLRVSPHEAPLILQLFAPDAGTLARGAEVALDINRRSGDPSFAGLGINMACPMPKVTKRGAGAALLKRPEEAAAMVRSLKALSLPVWVKMRRLEDDAATLRFIEDICGAGVDNVCIHGRTTAQRYEGVADRGIVAVAAARFPGLISASGDVRTEADIQEYLEMGCAPVMLARGALMDPWLLPAALESLGYEIPPELLAPTTAQRLERLRWLGDRAQETVGEKRAVVLLKRLMGGIFKGAPGAAELRRRAGSAQGLEEFYSVLELPPKDFSVFEKDRASCYTYGK